MIRYRSIIIQIVYVFFGCAALWSMIDSPFYSTENQATGYIMVDAVIIVWSLYMFISGFIALAKNVYNQSTSDHNIHLRMFMIMRLALAVLFGIGTQWFFVQAMLEYMN